MPRLRQRAQEMACVVVVALTFSMPTSAQSQPGQDKNPGTQQEKPDAKTSSSASQGGFEILSDTMGFDFGPYMRRLRSSVLVHWNELIPKVARPPESKPGAVTIELDVMRDGQARGMKIIQSSGDLRLDQAAWRGIVNALPLPRLPNEFKGDHLRLRCNFFYNSAPKPAEEKPQK